MPAILAAASVVCMAVALAGPRTPDAETKISREGIAIMMVVDRSSSMNARDLVQGDASVDRLTAVKRVFRQFVLGGEGAGQGVRGDEGDLDGEDRNPRALHAFSQAGNDDRGRVPETRKSPLNGYELEQYCSEQCDECDEVERLIRSALDNPERFDDVIANLEAAAAIDPHTPRPVVPLGGRGQAGGRAHPGG